MVILRAASAAPADRPVLTLAELEAWDVGTTPDRATRRFCCPLPGCADKPRDAEHRSLSLEVATGLWHCFRCDAGGKLREHWEVRPHAHVSGRAAARQAFGLGTPPSRRAEVPISSPVSDSTAEAVAPTPPSRRAEPNSQVIAGTLGATYLEGRGISVVTATAAGVRFAPSWYGRPAVIFSVRDQAGAVVAWEGRYIDGAEQPKGKSMGPKSTGVFLGAPGALLANPLVLVEGAIDALSLAECGVPAVALNGKTWPAWLPKAAAFRDVLIGLDADEPGQKATKALAKVLTFGSHVARFKPQGAKDWNALLEAEGAAWLGRHAFSRASSYRYRAVWRRLSVLFEGLPPPAHPALEAAIDTADWQAFDRELKVYERISIPTDAPAVPVPVVIHD